MKRTQLNRRTQLSRGKPLARMSKKKRRALPARRAAVREARERACGRCEWPQCGRRGTDAHERLTRARGGSVTDADNIVWLCREHHDAAHANPVEALRSGMLASINKAVTE